MKKNIIKNFVFTDKLIKELPLVKENKDRYVVSDLKCPYFKCRVGTKFKTYIVIKKTMGTPLCITIGNVNEISSDKARERAYEYLQQIVFGNNPNTIKQEIRNETTLNDLFSEFRERYADCHVCEKTLHDMIYVYNNFLSNFSNRRLSEIRNRDIQLIFNKVKKENGLYAANRMLSLIKNLFNRAIEWGWEGRNPTLGIKKFKEEARERFLLPEEFNAFFHSLDQEANPIFRTFFYALLYTGQRKSNVLEMRWDNIDFISNVWYIPNTKNGTSMRVPLVSQLVEKLKSIQGLFNNSPWVFPMNDNPMKHLVNPKKHWKALLQRAKIKDFRIHDLRRTMGSYECMNGVNLAVVSRTLNHKSLKATQVYARVDTSVVKNAMQLTVNKYQDFINLNQKQIIQTNDDSSTKRIENTEVIDEKNNINNLVYFEKKSENSMNINFDIFSV